MTTEEFCYLTTTGRRTGQPHRIEIWFAADGDTLYLLSGGRRSAHWVQNLEAEPEVTVEVGGQVRRARARVIDDAAEDERARDLVFAKYAPRYGDLLGWRGSALPIALDLITP